MFRRILIVALAVLLCGGIVFTEERGGRPFLSSFSSPPPVKAAHVPQVPILMYHKVNPDGRSGGLGLRVPPDRFAEQMEYLHDNEYRTISLFDLVSFLKEGGELPPRPVVITFDDGYLDNYLYAFPVLKKYGFTATIFVVASYVGKTNLFDVKAGLQPENPLAGWEQLKEMAAYGITIGSHTLDHPRLTRLSPEKAFREIKESREKIEKELGRPVLFFSYPYGSYNEEIVRMVEKSGYLAAVTTAQGTATPGSNPYTLKRIRVLGTYDLRKFASELNKPR